MIVVCMERMKQYKKNRRFFILYDQSIDVRDTFVSLILLLVQIVEQDPTFLSLLLTILIFFSSKFINERRRITIKRFISCQSSSILLHRITLDIFG
jgi:hypothetical protein